MVFFILSHFADKIKRQYKFSKLFFKNLLQIFSIYGIIATLRKTHADVAQLVEQLIRNQQVAGSSPAISSKEGMPFIRYSFFFIFLKKTAAVLCDCRCLFNLFLLIKSVNI